MGIYFIFYVSTKKILQRSFFLQLEKGDHYSIIVEDYLTKFTIHDSERKHSGVYTISAENSSGSDEATVEIVVLGRCILIMEYF